MIDPVWHDGPLDTLAFGTGPVAWSVALAEAPNVASRREDLADAADHHDGAARLARRLLARALIARLADCAADTVAIDRSRHGAPIVTAPTGWHVGLSGRGDRALIAAARSPIAADREPLDGGEVLWDMATPREAAAMRALPPDRQASDWLLRWTMKEAHAKLIGQPRRIAPEDIETRPDADGGGSATFEGVSDIWSRIAHGGVETIAMWREPVPSPIGTA